jgi:DNA uptake protein ComE-like DNA-binding protein
MISIVALWILAVLSLTSVGSAHRVSLELKVTQYELDRLRAGEAAEAGLRRAAFEIQSCWAGLGCEGQGWQDNPEAFREIALDGATFSVRYRRAGTDAGGGFVFGVRDEERDINVNTASAQVLEMVPGMKRDVVEGILDWRSKSRSLGLDEAFQGFVSLEEIKEVPGVTEDIYRAVQPYLTVYGSGKVNVNTASPEVLTALGMPPAIVGRIEILRGTEGPFGSIDALMDDLEKLGPLTSYEIRALQFIIDRRMLTTTSTAFHVISEGRSGRASATVDVVLERTEHGDMVATYWKRT